MKCLKTLSLSKVRKLANKKGIILIFDECTSGFRKNFGGLHKIYKVYPDIALFGKALGNGYAITAVVGKKDVMKNAKILSLVVLFGLKELSCSGFSKPKRNETYKILGNY